MYLLFVVFRTCKCSNTVRGKKEKRNLSSDHLRWSISLSPPCPPTLHTCSWLQYSCWATIDLLQGFSIPIPPLAYTWYMPSLSWSISEPTNTPNPSALVISVSSLIRLSVCKEEDCEGYTIVQISVHWSGGERKMRENQFPSEMVKLTVWPESMI